MRIFDTGIRGASDRFTIYPWDNPATICFQCDEAPHRTNNKLWRKRRATKTLGHSITWNDLPQEVTRYLHGRGALQPFLSKRFPLTTD